MPRTRSPGYFIECAPSGFCIGIPHADRAGTHVDSATTGGREDKPKSDRCNTEALGARACAPAMVPQNENQNLRRAQLCDEQLVITSLLFLQKVFVLHVQVTQHTRTRNHIKAAIITSHTHTQLPNMACDTTPKWFPRRTSGHRRRSSRACRPSTDGLP